MDTLEKLLLLEFLVDNVYYEKTAIDPQLLQGLADTNVRFQFLDFPPIDIGEVDFCPTGEGYERSEISFKSGKSILFALPDVSRGMSQTFDICVTVSRKVKTENETEKPELRNLGKTIIHLGDSFVNLLEATSYDGVCPTSRTVRDSYPFEDNGAVTGFLTVFIRLSCFGKIIVTQFQGDGLADKSFCFKGGEDEAVPQPPPEAEESAGGICGAYGGFGGGFGGGEMPMMMGMPPMMGGMPPMMGGMPPMMGGGMPPGMMPQTINVPVPLKKRDQSNKCGKVPPELLSSDSEGEKKGPYCLRKDCPQHYPRPPWIAGAKHSVRTIAGPPAGAVTFQGDDILFQMRNPLAGNSAVPKSNTIFQVNNEPDQDRQKVQMTHPDVRPEMDDEHDVFLLRFGKRDAQNKPAKLIVTLKTPKAPDFNQHKCKSDQYIQTECAKNRKKANKETETQAAAQAAEAVKPVTPDDKKKGGKKK